MRGGQSLSQAAKSIHIDPERLWAYIKDADVEEKKSGRWQIDKGTLQRIALLLANLEIQVNPKEAKKVGACLSAVSSFLSGQFPSP